MQSKATTPDAYIESLPEDRKKIVADIRKTLKKNLPKGFQETMGYGMLCYVVPHSLYPPGYHCDPSLALPFISLASQKNHIALYHMGLYAMPAQLAWFTKEWEKHSSKKMDMGKSCLRFKKAEDVPMELIAALAARITPADWIKTYESVIKTK